MLLLHRVHPGIQVREAPRGGTLGKLAGEGVCGLSWDALVSATSNQALHCITRHSMLRFGPAKTAVEHVRTCTFFSWMFFHVRQQCNYPKVRRARGLIFCLSSEAFSYYPRMHICSASVDQYFNLLLGLSLILLLPPAAANLHLIGIIQQLLPTAVLRGVSLFCAVRKRPSMLQYRRIAVYGVHIPGRLLPGGQQGLPVRGWA